MKKSQDIKKFDEAYKKYFSETDSKLHKKALETLLEEIDLDDVFVYWLDEKGEIERFFLTWEKAGKLEKDPRDRKGMEKIGRLSKKYYYEKKYKELFELFFDIMFRNFVELAGIKERKDFEDITDVDLYEKNIIPSEIFLQYFLIESPIKKLGFDWNRNDEIMKQNLACLIVCFGDIYEFMNGM